MISGARASLQNDASSSLRDVCAAEWAWRRQEIPDNEDTTRPVASYLPRVDRESQENRLRYWEDILGRIDRISRDELSCAERINYDTFRAQIEVLIANQRFRDYEMPVNADSMFWTDLAYTARRPFLTRQDYLGWIAQMRDIPRFFRDQSSVMRAGLERRFTPPRITMRGRDASIAAVLDASPETSVFYTPFRTMVGVAAPEQARLRADAVKVIQDVVKPAYGELLEFMQAEYLPGGRESLAAYDLPDGEAYYQAKIREFTTLDLSPAAIHELGVTEVAELRAKMKSVMRETGFAGEIPAFLAFLRTDAQFYAKSADELLMRAAWIAKKFDAKASQYFGHLPRARFSIEPVADDIAPFYTAGRGGAGYYLVNTFDLASRPLYNLPALTLHESAPGHAFQMSLALEHADQPEFRRHTYNSAYGEGWALYCEQLGEEMGLYETPYERFGMLGYQIWRAARLVVDTGLHTQGWTRERAMAYLSEYTPLQQREIETEVDRYISWPAQALSYYVGKVAMVEARTAAERALGDAFDLRAFHDAVLELGSVPLSVLKRHMRDFAGELNACH